MAQRRPFSHILFDLDRTLVHYPVATAGIVSETFQRLGLSVAPFGSPERIAALYDALWVALERGARGADELRVLVWKRLLAARGLTADGLAERVAGEYGRLRRIHGVRLYEGVPALLDDLGAAGYGLGLLTNGLSDAQWDKIRSTGLAPRFAAILVAGDVGLYKPDPHAFEALLGRLGAARDRALFVGDSYDMDVVGAAAAGIACAWVRAAGAPPPGPVLPEYQMASVLEVREVAL